MNFFTYTTIGAFVLIAILRISATTKAAKFAKLGNALRVAKASRDYWQKQYWDELDVSRAGRGLVESRTEEVLKWRKLFGPFPSLYENSPEAEGAHDHNDQTIAIDLDGVIIEYVSPWSGVAHFGDVIPGAAEAIGELKELGYKIVIYTTRNNALAGINTGYNALELTALVQNVLEKNGIPYDFIALFKPLARYYIDDRAIRFDKDWPGALETVSYYEQTRLLDRAREIEKAIGGPATPEDNR